MQRVYLSRHFVSFRNISQNCPMPSSPVNVTFCPSTSIRYCERVRSRGIEPNLLNSGTPRDTVYSRGKGVNKQKTNKQINCVCLVKSAGCDVAFGGCLQTLAFFRATHFLSLRAKKRGPQKILLYFWGKGVCKHKTGNCRLRRLTGQKRSIRRVAISRKGHRIIKPTQDTFVLAWRKKGAHKQKSEHCRPR